MGAAPPSQGPTLYWLDKWLLTTQLFVSAANVVYAVCPFLVRRRFTCCPSGNKRLESTSSIYLTIPLPCVLLKLGAHELVENIKFCVHMCRVVATIHIRTYLACTGLNGINKGASWVSELRLWRCGDVYMVLNPMGKVLQSIHTASVAGQRIHLFNRGTRGALDERRLNRVFNWATWCLAMHRRLAIVVDTLLTSALGWDNERSWLV